MVPADGLSEYREQTLLHPSEVELGETVRDIMAKVDEVKPARVVIDSLSELRLLAQTPVRYRKRPRISMLSTKSKGSPATFLLKSRPFFTV